MLNVNATIAYKLKEEEELFIDTNNHDFHAHLRTRSNNHALNPQSNECKKRSKCGHHVCIISSRLFDHRSKLTIVT